MSKVNIHNYEAFYLDYLEGNLNKADTETLFRFLDKNPQLKNDSEDIAATKLHVNLNIKINKEPLYQNIDESNIEDYIIASIENEIEAGTEDAIELENYLTKSLAAKALATRYQKTILSKPIISYPDKRNLKKNVSLAYYLTPIVSVAASIVMLFLISKPSFNELNTTNQIAYQNTELQETIADKIVMNKEPEIPEVTKYNNTNYNGLNNEKTSKIKHNIPEIKQKLTFANKQITDTENNIISKVKTVEIVNAKDETRTHADTSDEIRPEKVIVNSDYSNIIAEHKSKSEPNSVVTKSTNNEFLTTQKPAISTKTKPRRIALWRVAKIGVKIFSRLNEKDIALERSVTTYSQVSSINLKKQKVINSPSI